MNFSLENLVVYEIMWKNILEPDLRLQTHTQNLLLLRETDVMRTRLSIMFIFTTLPVL